MHFAISSTYGPTDPTRAMLPFLFAASALQNGDSVTLMLFHDSVLMSVGGKGAELVPVGPPNAYEEAVGHDGMKLLVCKPCFDVRALPEAKLDPRAELCGMKEFHEACARGDTRVVSF